MKPEIKLAVPVIALALLAAGYHQQSVKVDYKTSIEKANKAYEAKSWGECTKHVRNALQTVQTSRIDAIRQSLPAAPSGMKIEDARTGEANIYLAGFMCQVERTYRSEDGDKSLHVNVQADSPQIAMIAPNLTNPVVVQASGGEVLEYGKQKAVLSKQGDEGKSWKLQIVIDQAHMVEVDATGITRDALLKVFDEVAVAKLAKELMN